MPVTLTDIKQAIVLVVALLRFLVGPMILIRLGVDVSLRKLGIRLRKFLDRSGLIYRKLGQYLAMRNDLLPSILCAELDLLFEGVTPMPFTEVQGVMAEELGPRWRERFAWFDPKPIGSASVAQVHRATALDGKPLAVKVQRRGIRRQFYADVRVFRSMASFCDKLRLTGSISLRKFFDEFVDFTERELDFEAEGRTADRLRQDVSPYGQVPTVRWELTTLRILSMDYVEGETFLTLCRLGEAGRTSEVQQLIRGIDFDDVMSKLADECFRQLFVTGFFHGDPHPGNVILRKDGTFVFLDFGISGELSTEHRRDLRGFVENLALRRFEESAYYYTRLCQPTAGTDINEWMTDVTAALADWYDSLTDPYAPIARRHMGSLQGNIAAAMRRHDVRSRPNQLLFWRALVLLDTTTLRLPVRFDLLNAMVSFFRRERPSPEEIIGSALNDFALEAPFVGRAVLRPALHLFAQPNPSPPLTVVRYASDSGSVTQNVGISRFVCALTGLGWGALAAHAGGGNLSSLSAVVSVAFLLLAARK